MKKIVVLIAVLVFLSGVSFAADFKGKVTKVDGKTVTIKITKGKASKLEVGSKVEIDAESKKAPKKSGGMLQGC